MVLEKEKPNFGRCEGGGASYTFGSFNFRRVYKASKLYLPQSYRSKSTRLQERKATDFSPWTRLALNLILGKDCRLSTFTIFIFTVHGTHRKMWTKNNFFCFVLLGNSYLVGVGCRLRDGNNSAKRICWITASGIRFGRWRQSTGSLLPAATETR